MVMLSTNCMLRLWDAINRQCLFIYIRCKISGAENEVESVDIRKLEMTRHHTVAPEWWVVL